jgi:hypothetical protein
MLPNFNDLVNFFLNGANAFNQDIGEWNVSIVTSMEGVSGNALAFNQTHWFLGRVKRDNYAAHVFSCI